MRAIVIERPGGTEVLRVVERPDLAPPPNHLRVRVAFAGVNRADILQRMGLYPAPPGASADVPGLEYAGTVDALGAGVTEVKEGDRVFGLVGGGAYADQLVVHEREVARIPDGLSLEQAAAVPEAFVTAYDALAVRGRLVPGERVLVTAAGSGVGTAGIQIARALGCFVAGTSRTPDKLERAKALGLDAAIVAKGAPDAIATALSAPCPAGYDVVLELVGGAYVEADIGACAPRGRIVVVGLTGGASASVNLGALLRKRLTIVGTVLRSRPLEEKIAAAELLRRTISPWLERGVVRAVVDRVVPMADAGRAHAAVEKNDTFGKVLLATS
jgi:putative PIG3 family NAD(P)H quinone oxidoreductase